MYKKESNESKIDYAVLFKSVFLDDSTIFYVPLYLIQGERMYDEVCEQEYFIDQLGFQRLYMEDLCIIDNHIENSVGCFIKKEDLQKRYQEVSLKDAEEYYFHEICSRHYMGLYSFDEEEQIRIIDIETADFVNAIVQDAKKDAYQEKIPINNNYEDVLLAISKECFEDILQSKDYETMKEKLQEISDDYKNFSEYNQNSKIIGQNVFYNESLVDEDIIQKFFNTYYQSFKFSSSLEEINDLLQYFENNLITFQTFLRDKVEEPLFISHLLLACKETKDSSQFEDMKKRICEVYEQELDAMEEFYTIYRETTKKNEITQQEKTWDEQFAEKLQIRKVREYLNEYIVGQEEAKMRVASAVVHNLLLEDMTFKSTCLLIGPTGSGKTLIAKTLCKYFDIPYVKIDSTQLTQVGYQGANPDVFLERLLASANGDIKKAQKGIVLFDEIDKKATAKEDVSGKNVLDMLLLFMEGTTYDVSYKSKQIAFDTSELIILAAGSFESMVKKMRRKSGNYKDTKLGFQAELQKQQIKEDIVYPKITLEDLGKYGNLSSEFLGRIPVVVQLEGHTKESLIRVLTEPKCNILYTLRKVFQHFSVELQWTEGYLEKVAEEALYLKVGARSLNSVVERSVWEARDEVNNAYYDGINYSKVLLTENTVLDSRDCLFFDDTGNSMSLKTILALREQSNQTLEKEKKITKKM